MSFALMGDMILCARSSYFLQAFRRIGLVPDCGSTWLLPRMIGQGRQQPERAAPASRRALPRKYSKRILSPEMIECFLNFISSCAG